MDKGGREEGRKTEMKSTGCEIREIERPPTDDRMDGFKSILKEFDTNGGISKLY